MTTIKVSPEVRDRLKELGAANGQTANEVVATLIDEHERHAYWDAYLRAADGDDDTVAKELAIIENASLSDIRDRL